MGGASGKFPTGPTFGLLIGLGSSQAGTAGLIGDDVVQALHEGLEMWVMMRLRVAESAAGRGSISNYLAHLLLPQTASLGTVQFPYM